MGGTQARGTQTESEPLNSKKRLRRVVEQQVFWLHLCASLSSLISQHHVPTMKFGQYLQENMEPDWKEFYVDYDGLKKIIKDMSSLDVPQVARATSLSVGQAPQPSSNTEEKSQKAQGEFIDALEKDMAKIELFVVGKLQEVPDARAKRRQLQLQVVVYLDQL